MKPEDVDAGRKVIHIEALNLKRSFAIHSLKIPLDNLLRGDEEFALAYGDILISKEQVSRLLNTHKNTASDMTALVTLSLKTERLGVAEIDEEGRIINVAEKPKGKKEMGHYVLAGLYIFKQKIFETLSSSQTLEETFKKAIKSGEDFRAAIWERKWIHLDYPWSLLEANQLLLSKYEKQLISVNARVEPNVILEGPVVIEKGVHIRSGSVIKGPCFIDENAYIGNNSLLRDCTYVGKNSIIGFGVEIKNSIIYDDVKIGRLSYIGDSVVGENTDIGPGTMTINRPLEGKTVKVMVEGKEYDTGLKKLGAFIGDDVTIDGSVAIYPGKKISVGVRIKPGITVSEDL